MGYNETPTKGTTMNKNEIIIVSAIIASAAIGYLTKAAVDDDAIVTLKKKLAVSKFNHLVTAKAFDAALDEVPSERADALNERIDTILKFEKIALHF